MQDVKNGLYKFFSQMINFECFQIEHFWHFCQCVSYTPVHIFRQMKNHILAKMKYHLQHMQQSPLESIFRIKPAAQYFGYALKTYIKHTI